MKITSLQPFVPSGADFESASQLFQHIGFTISWNAGDYIGFEKDGFSFILQRYHNKDFAENFMMNVGIENAGSLYQEFQQLQLTEKFGVRVTEPKNMPYGIEVILIDMAGVCWHFVQPM